MHSENEKEEERFFSLLFFFVGHLRQGERLGGEGWGSEAEIARQ